MLEVEDAKGREDEETEKREQLVAPFHSPIYEPAPGLVNPQPGNHLSVSPNIAKVSSCRGRSFSSFATVGASIPAASRNAEKTVMRLCSRGHRFMISCIATIHGPD